MDDQETKYEDGVRRLGFVCPRRGSTLGPAASPGADDWCGDPTGSGQVCSYCGSLHPDRFMALAEEGKELEPTDKSYKVYVSGFGKFYFQHLDIEQRKKFVELMNARKLKLAYPGHFYIPPFFVR